MLSRATPLVERELQSALRSRAFDGYDLISDLDGDGGDGAAGGKMHTLEVQLQQSLLLRASCVAWSSSASSPALAVAFQHPEHGDWYALR